MTTTAGFKRASKPIPPAPTATPPGEERIPPRAKVEVPLERPGPVAKWVTNAYQTGGRVFQNLGDPVCGQAVYMSADSAGMAWQRAYKTYPVVKRMLDYFMQTSVGAELFMAHLPIALAVLAHHVPEFRDFVRKSSLAFMANLPEMPEEPVKDTDAA